MASSPKQRLIVTGATGKQGGALIQALLAHPQQPFEIYAVTRNTTSNGAKALASKPNVHVIQGDFDAPERIFSQVEKPISALFSVTTPDLGKRDAAASEERQGIAMAQAAIEAGVGHIVYTSVDRGVNSDANETPIPHFRSKKHVEDAIVKDTKGTATTWTFIRPVAFMDNLSNDFFGKTFATMWRQNGADRKLQLISSGDIGRVAAEALLHSSEAEYKNKAISIAGDSVSPDEAVEVFCRITGQEMPATYGVIGTALKWYMADEIGKMFAWFKQEGYGADVPELRRRYPFLKDFGQWLEDESAWSTSK